MEVTRCRNWGRQQQPEAPVPRLLHRTERRWQQPGSADGAGLRRASHLFWTAPPTAGRPCPGQRRCEGHRCCRSELELEAAACEEKLQLPALLQEQRSETRQRNEQERRWSQEGSPASIHRVAPPPSVAQVQLDVMLEDGDEQHDGEAQQDARVLQQEVASVANAVVASVVVKHLWHLITPSSWLEPSVLCVCVCARVRL